MGNDSSFLQKNRRIRKQYKGRIAYFTLLGRKNCHVCNGISSPDQMFDACEPLLMLGGIVHRDMIVTLDDIRKEF